MLIKIAAVSLGAIIALAPLGAMAQTDQAAPGATTPAPAATTGTHRAMTKSRSHQRARASAHHMHKMSTTPAAPATPAAPPPQ